MYPLGTWFVPGICVWLPCIKETTTTTTTTTITIIITTTITIYLFLTACFRPELE